MTEDVKKLPDGFKDPRDKLVLNEVPIIDVSDLPRAPITPLSKEQYRNAVITIDKEFVGPYIDTIAKAVGVDVIDDKFYDEVVPTTDKASSIFVIRSRRRVFYQQEKGYAEWEGIEVLVKNYVVAGAQVRAYASNNEGAFMYVRLFDKRQGKEGDYIYHGDPEGQRRLTVEAVPRLILNYLEQEGIIPGHLGITL